MIPAAVYASPSPSPSPAPKEIGRVVVRGRTVNLVGKALAASSGTIDREQIETRPIQRPGELLEVVPGLLVSQHSGGGKANQYYLRGFQLDHGTDLESTVNGVPVNLPTHAHGQGYSDINWLVPELVSYVGFRKGPYYADAGDFSTAGSYDVHYRDVLARPLAEFGAGSYGFGNVLIAGSPAVGSGALLYGLQLYHDDGSFQRPDGYLKENGVLRWSRATPGSEFDVTAMGYRGTFRSSDQIPQRLVAAGELNPYGLIDPSDGGTTSRFALSSEYVRTDARGTTSASAYGFEQKLRLFSNFTYYLDDATDYYNVTRNPVTCTVAYTTCTPGRIHTASYASYCPENDVAGAARMAPHSVAPAPFSFACGDQREQADARFVSGLRVSRAFVRRGPFETSAGLGLRNDNVSTVGLFLTAGAEPYAGGTLSLARVVERDAFAWVQTQVTLGKLRVTPGLRADAYAFHVAAQSPRDGGNVTAAIVDPKLIVAYALSPSQELYADWGQSFHSNDARGLTESIDPQTHASFDPAGSPVQRVSPLVRAEGFELGYRYSHGPLNSTLALWQLHADSELVFDGDAGVTVAGGPTMRRGIEIANFYRPVRWLTIDADAAVSSARFLRDPLGQGTFVPESIDAVEAIGATATFPSLDASLRMRYFGPRVLDQAGAAVSAASLTYDAQATWRSRRGYALVADVFNLFNARADDVEYYYASWLPRDAANPAYARNPAVNPLLGGGGVNDYHFHPAQRRSFRLSVLFR